MSNPTDEPGTRGTQLEDEVNSQRRFLWASAEAAGWAMVAAALAIVLVTWQRPSTPLWRELFNVAHVLLSGGIALVALRLSRRMLAAFIERRVGHFAVAAFTAITAGAGLEALQWVGPGDPSAADLVRDALGAAAALSLVWTLDSQRSRSKAGSRSGDWAVLVAAIGMLCAALIPTLQRMVLLAHQRASFPVLADFESSWDRRFVKAEDGATLSLEAAPPGFAKGRGTVAKVTFASGIYPKLELTGVSGDWSRFAVLEFEVFSEATAPQSLEIRVHDGRHAGAYDDRFNRVLTIEPGGETVSIPLSQIRDAPAGRMMDMRDIRALILFVGSPADSRTFYLDRFRLE